MSFQGSLANIKMIATGEADYLPDIPSRPDELFGAFVQSTIGNGTVKLIDTSKALVQSIPIKC